MLIGTFCRFSLRFCAVTVTASSVAALFSELSCATTDALMARLMAMVNGTRVKRVAERCSGLADCLGMVAPSGDK
jgi:hypothetical protein